MLFQADPLDRSRHRPAARCAALCGALVLAACMVGPDYETPSVSVPDQWGDAAGTGAPPDTLARWWEQFGDPVLARLVAEAAAQNLTLQQAGLRVIQARALRGLAAGEFFPQVQAAAADASAQRISKNAPAGIGDRTYETYGVGLQAAWELDFWGKFRRGIESADASLQAAVADYDAFRVALIADVASEYVTMRSLQEQLATTRANVTAQADTLALVEVRMRAGAVGEIDVATAQATLANTQAAIPALEQELRSSELALGVLLGRAPAALAGELGTDATVPTPPTVLACGVPADLLRRRPDVRAAERQAAAFSALIGAAKAEAYPSLTLTGTTGFVTSTSTTAGRSGAENLFDADSFEGFIGLGINWPLLDYARIQNRVRANDARFEEAVAAYRESVLVAAADVERGLSRFLRGGERAELLATSARAAQRTVELSLLQYQRGAADFLRVNQAQVDLVQRQNLLVIARAGTAQAAIATWRALGGGWERRERAEYVPAATIDTMRARTDWGDVLDADYAAGSDALFARPPELPVVNEPLAHP